ncbi:MAG: branched-chain amino acid ABC transporter permease [Anaerolineae bacterium]|jgi:ABC-type branched-subunit amino acid transport system permease subunit|nr:branched-chain amino acid ABC transporter permease [Anaerolineae bacterium]
MAASIRPSGVFDTQYTQDIALNRTRGEKRQMWLAFGLLLLVPLLTIEGPIGAWLNSIQIGALPTLWVGLISRIAIYAIAVQGLNMLMGYTGQISLGHAAFMGIGAYSAAVMARELGLPFWVAVPLAALFTGVIGLLFGIPSLRVKGFYLAMATLAAQFIIPWVLRYPLEPLTNGSRPLEVPAPLIEFSSYSDYSASVTNGTPSSYIFQRNPSFLSDVVRVTTVSSGAAPRVSVSTRSGQTLLTTPLTDGQDNVIGLQFIASGEDIYIITAEPAADTLYRLDVRVNQAVNFSQQNAMYYIIVPVSVLMFLVARNIIRSRVGRAFISIRDNDLAAELLGINVFSYKLQAFFLSSLYAGLAGALWAFDTGTLSIDKFTLTLSIEFLAMLVIGGAGFPLGAVMGVTFISLLSQYLIPALLPVLNSFLPALLPFINAVNLQAALSPTLFGLAIALFLIIEPRGLAYRWEILKIAWKIRPYAY